MTASVYPGALDSSANLPYPNNGDTALLTWWANLSDCVIAIETTLGINMGNVPGGSPSVTVVPVSGTPATGANGSAADAVTSQPAAGTYFVIGWLNIQEPGAAQHMSVRLFDGTAAYGGKTITQEANWYLDGVVFGKIVVASGGTIHLQAWSQGAAGTVIAGALILIPCR